MSKLKLTALWEKTIPTKNGPVKIMSGYLGDARIEIWPNGFKKDPRSPDWVVYVSPKPDKGSYEANDMSSNELYKNDHDLPF